MENLERVIDALGGQLLYAVIEISNDEDIYGDGPFEVHYSALGRGLAIEASSEEARANRYSIVAKLLAAHLDKVG